MRLSLLFCVCVLALGACKSQSTEPAASAGAEKPAEAAAEKPPEAAEEEEPAAAAEEEPAAAAEEEPAAAEATGLKLSGPKALAELAAEGLGVREDGIGLAVGTKVAAFDATTFEGDDTNLENLLEDGPILVVFYRGGWCPYCNFQIKQLTDAAARFQAAGVTPVLVSVDKPDAAALAQKSYEIPFPVLSDPETLVHDAFGVTYSVDAETLAKLKGYGHDLSAWSGLEAPKLGHPGIFLVDGEGVVQWAHVAKDYRVRPSADQLVEVVTAWKAKTQE